MMALAYPMLKPHLSKKEKASWLQSIEKAGDYLVKMMSPKFASINYCATTTASLMAVNELIKKQSYQDKARELAYLVAGKMDQDYFLTGEGGRVFGVKYGIDLGYNSFRCSHMIQFTIRAVDATIIRRTFIGIDILHHRGIQF